MGRRAMGNGFLLPTADRAPTPVHKLSAVDYELDEQMLEGESDDRARAFNCAICQSSVGWDIVETLCGHRFCQKCILEWKFPARARIAKPLPQRRASAVWEVRIRRSCFGFVCAAPGE